MVKEISSNGDFSTVDVVFPASPLIAWVDPALLRLILVPILTYANNETNRPYGSVWAPHHLGTYPIADILTSEQEDMPIEETANLIMMVALVARMEGSLHSTLDHFWPLYYQWANYLVSSLPDPGDQLCTDDFTGAIPHDANLALKGIIGIGAYSYLCTLKGDTVNASKFMSVAQDYASQWIQLANPTSSDHYRLRYDMPGWSMKYNLVYQRLLALSVFPESVFSLETQYYKTMLNKYGVPLDNRDTFTKLDWESWVATQETADPTFFGQMFDAIYSWANTTPNRVPLTDLYYTITGSQYIDFRARPVVGGLFVPLLLHDLSKPTN
eukprot:TRINITY_DN1175_c0_g2_i2.p1 TRINITY_DN1175_c0_g2~~TRINITY_DN1175_c0_g2_i2.p1  ORF type:complete len:326 (+),score=71.58 TRINITY_DN1175_c0_g2_i2:205-1182(+)